jgi:hypothetical protein
MKRTLYITSILAALSFVSACAPSLGVRMSVPSLPEQSQIKKEGDSEPAPNLDGVKVRVSPFMDARSSSAIAVVDGRNVSPDGSLGPLVQAGFEQYIRDAGGRIAVLQGATLIEGEIVDWRAKVMPKFPASDAKATAKIKVNVKDPRTQFIKYRGTFSGEATATHPFLTESDIQKLLTDAMAGAITAALQDESFVLQLQETPRG